MLFIDAALMLHGDEFVRPGHRVLYETLVAMRTAGEPIDLVLLSERLRHPGRLERVGGNEYLARLVDGVPSTASCENYAAIVRGKAMLRRIISATGEAAEAAYGADVDAEQIGRDLQIQLYHIVAGRDPRGPVRIGDAANAVMAKAYRVRNGEEPPGVMYGMPAIDNLTGGMEPGQLVILAAGTSKGKSSLALHVGEHVAGHGTVLFVSREMSESSLAKRALQARTGISAQSIRFACRLDVPDLTKLELASAELENVALWIDTTSQTTSDIGARARLLAATERGLALIVVDYLQLLDWQREGGKGESKATAVGKVAWGLKTMAMELNVPVLALSQFNRSPDRAERPPELSDLRDSGEIENHADVVILLHHPKGEQLDMDGRIIVLARVAKQREGPTNSWDSYDKIELLFDRTRTSFVVDGQIQEGVVLWQNR